MSCGVGRWLGSDPELLWLWHRPAATAPIRPLAWEPPYVAGAALKRLYTHTHTHTHTQWKRERQSLLLTFNLRGKTDWNTKRYHTIGQVWQQGKGKGVSLYILKWSSLFPRNTMWLAWWFAKAPSKLLLLGFLLHYTLYPEYPPFPL